MTPTLEAPAPKPPIAALLALLLLGLVAALLGGCTTGRTLPPQAPPAVRVEVPVPVACEIEQVPAGPRPSAQAQPDMGIYDLTKIALAERRILLGENERLRAANNTPCPGASR